MAEVLRDALAEGRLTLEELDERLEAALRARTFADLDPLVADLPVEPPSTTARRSPLPTRRQGTGPGWSDGDRLVLDAGWSSVTRSGRWEIPPYLRLNSSAGVVRLDCLQATPLAELIDVEVIGAVGTITLVVPASWGADHDRLRSPWGTARFKVSVRPEAGSPLLAFHGSVGIGMLTVRHAGWFDRRRLARQGVGLPQRAIGR